MIPKKIPQQLLLDDWVAAQLPTPKNAPLAEMGNLAEGQRNNAIPNPIIQADHQKVKKSRKVWYYANHEKAKASMAAWYMANREKRKISKKAYYEANKEKIINNSKQYARSNAAKIKIRMAAWGRANSEILKLKQAARYASNRDKILKKHRAWCAANRDKIINLNQKRRALKRGASVGDASLISKWSKSWKRKREARCYWCQINHPVSECHIDHIIALSLGGEHSVENLCVSCATCNMKKRNRPLHKWNNSLALPVLSL